MHIKAFRLLPVLITSAFITGVPLATHAESQEEYLRNVTVINLNAEAHRTTTQDRLQATLNIEATGKTAAEAQRKINEKMTAAKTIYDAATGIKVSTGNYNVYKNTPITHNPQTGQPLPPEQIEAKSYWQGNQQIIFDSSNKDTLLTLIGKLQDQGFAVQNLNFYLSREAADQLRDDLLDEALGTIKKRAQRMASRLGLTKIHYARVDLGGGPTYPYPVPMARGALMAMDAKAEAMPSPVAQSGESDVNLNVNVEVHLSK